MKINTIKLALLLLFIAGLVGMVPAQKQTISKLEISEHVQQIPDEAAHSVGTLAEALTQGLADDEAKAYAIYCWVTRNLTYDLAGAENLMSYTSMDEVTNEALTKRTGVCSHYAQLFDALANEAGLPSMVVSGYVKSEHEIYKIPHAWNALRLDGDWYLFDPTWGSGYVDWKTNRYHQEYSEKFFKIPPSVMIKTHMPFDPLMQMLNNPVTPAEFAEDAPPAEDRNLDFKTEIERYRMLTEQERLPEIIARMEQQGMANEMIKAQHANLLNQYNVYLANQQIIMHNSVIYKLTDVIDDYNKYVVFANSHRSNSADELRRMTTWLQRIQQNALAVSALMDTLPLTPDLQKSYNYNRKSLNELLSTVASEQMRLKEK